MSRKTTREDLWVWITALASFAIGLFLLIGDYESCALSPEAAQQSIGPIPEDIWPSQIQDTGRSW